MTEIRFFEYPGTNMIRYTFPLRPDMEVTLTLPKDVTLREVKRLTMMLMTLPDEPFSAE